MSGPSGGAYAPSSPTLVDTGGNKKKGKKKHITGRPPKFGAGERTKGGVAQRARNRFRSLGGNVAGVKASDGFTGAEARKLKRLAPHGGKAPAAHHGGHGHGKGGNPAQRRFNSMMADATRQANYEYAPEQRLLKQDMAREKAHTSTIAEAFDKYKAHTDQLIADQQSANQRSQALLDQGQARADATTAAMGADTQAALADRAATLGQSTASQDEQRQGAEMGAAVQAGANQRADTLSQSTGEAAAGGLRIAALSGEQSRQNALREQSGRMDQLSQKRGQLQRDKRNFRTKLLSDNKKQAQETYLAILALQQKDLSAKEDRQLRLQLGLMDSQDAAAQRQSQESMNAQDNATALAVADKRAAAGKSGAKSAGGLPPGQRREWRQLKAHFTHGAERMRTNLKRFKDTDSAWHQTAVDLGGRLSRDELSAMWWIAKGGKIPKGVQAYLQSKFPGGKSPW